MAIKKINHLAVVVEDLDTALDFWTEKLGLTLDHITEVPEQATKAAFLPVGDSAVELVQPTNEESGMAKYLAKKGAGMHHLCFEVDDIRQHLADLKAQDVVLINEEPLSRDGKLYAFVHPKSTGGVSDRTLPDPLGYMPDLPTIHPPAAEGRAPAQMPAGGMQRRLLPARAPGWTLVLKQELDANAALIAPLLSELWQEPASLVPA